MRAMRRVERRESFSTEDSEFLVLSPGGSLSIRRIAAAAPTPSKNQISRGHATTLNVTCHLTLA